MTVGVGLRIDNILSGENMEKVYLKEVSERKFWQVLLWVLIALTVVIVVAVPRQPKQTKIVSEVSGSFGQDFSTSVKNEEIY